MELIVDYSGSIGIVQPPANQVYQRDTLTGGLFGKGSGTLALGINLSVPAFLMEAQLRDAGRPGNVVASWFPVATDLSGGTQTIAIGLPANAAWYLIDLRADGDPASLVSTTNRVGVGEVVVAAGQSLAADFWGTDASGDKTTLAALGVEVSPFGSAFAAWNGITKPIAWATPSDGGVYTSSFAAEFLRLAVAATGVNVALVGYAFNGSTISSWQPGQSNYLALMGVLTQMGGGFGTLFWCQGHQDAKLPGADGNAYVSAVGNIFSALSTSFPGTRTRVLCSIPAIGTAAAGRFDAKSIDVVRQAHLRYVASDPLAHYVSGLDVAVAADGIHPSQLGNVVFARHFYRAFMAGLQQNSFGDDGPRVVAATRSPGSAEVALRLAAAGTLNAVGDISTQFQMYPAGQTTGIAAVKAADVATPGLIVLHLEALPPDDQAFDLYYRSPWDSSASINAGIYDRNVDSDGLARGRQLNLFGGAFRVLAPSGCRPALLCPGMPMLARPVSVALAGD